MPEIPGAGSAPGLRERKKTMQRRVCLILMAVILPVLLYVEWGHPTFSDEVILQELISMTLTRALAACVFLSLLIYEGYRVLNPFRKPFLRSFLWTVPAFLVAVNNMPILALVRGDIQIMQHSPVYWFWFISECLAIGLFEEVAFRGVVLLMFAEKRRRTRKGLFMSIILTSAVFGVVHLVNLLMGAGIGSVLLQIGYSFLIGAMCALVLFKTANLWFCVLLHAVYDFGGHFASTVGDGGPIWNRPTVIFTAVLAVLVTAYMVWQFFRMKPEETERIYRSVSGADRANGEQWTADG